MCTHAASRGFKTGFDFLNSKLKVMVLFKLLMIKVNFCTIFHIVYSLSNLLQCTRPEPVHSELQIIELLLFYTSVTDYAFFGLVFILR